MQTYIRKNIYQDANCVIHMIHMMNIFKKERAAVQVGKIRENLVQKKNDFIARANQVTQTR